MSRIVRFFLILLAAPALAQDPPEANLWDYLKAHASVVSGVAAANGARAEYVSLALDDSFTLKPRFIGFGSLSLFGRQRESGPSIPSSFEDLALYSAGEITAGVFWEATPKFALECRTGMSFSMIGLTGTVGEPIDGSKFTFGCGPRVTGSIGTLSVILGHSGPVDQGAKYYGFIPSTVYDGSFRLTDSSAFLVYIAAGRDLLTNKAVTSARFSVRKAFK